MRRKRPHNSNKRKICETKKKASMRTCGKYQLTEYKIAPNEQENHNDMIEISQNYKRLILSQCSNSIRIN